MPKIINKAKVYAREKHLISIRIPRKIKKFLKNPKNRFLWTQNKQYYMKAVYGVNKKKEGKYFGVIIYTNIKNSKK